MTKVRLVEYFDGRQEYITEDRYMDILFSGEKIKIWKVISV